MTTKPNQNENEFPNIKGALMALECLENKIDEIRETFRNNQSADSTEGWTEEENFGYFAENMLDDDKEFLRKLVNLGLCL